MTISSNSRKAGPYSGNDVAVAFPFAFKVFSTSDVYVVYTSATNEETVLTLDTDYTVTLNSNQDTYPGGTVTLPAALATGTKLTLTSSVAELQPVTLTNNGGFYPAVINTALDRATIQIQQLAEKQSRSLVWPISSETAGSPAPVANKFIGWNATGTELVNLDGVAVGDAQTVAFNQAGSGAVQRTAQDKMRDLVSVKDFGAVGDGSFDDTTAIQNAFNAAVGKLILLGPQETYQITSITIPAGVTLISCGSSFVRSSASATYGITITGDFIADSLIYSSPGSVAAIDNGVKITGSNVSIGHLSSFCDTVDYGHYGVRIEGASNIKNISIDRLDSKNWKSHIQVFNVDDVQISDIDITSYVTGLYLRDVTNAKFSGGHIKTMSPSATGGPGNNGILVESTLSSGSTNNVHFSDFTVENAGEHAVRFGGELTIHDVWLSRIKTINSGAFGASATGGTGIKILGASQVVGQKHKRFHLTDCTVLDVNVTGAGVGNFCGFILAAVEDVQLNNCVVGTVSQAQSCWIGIELISAERVSINNTILNNCKQTVIRFNAETDLVANPGMVTPVKEVTITGCHLRNLTNSYGLYFIGLKGDYSEILVDACVIYGGGNAAVIRADAPSTGSYGDIQINAVHRDPADATGGPALQCGNRFRYNWVGPYYGTFGPNGLDGSVFVDTTTGAYKLRKAGAWSNL